MCVERKREEIEAKRARKGGILGKFGHTFYILFTKIR